MGWDEVGLHLCGFGGVGRCGMSGAKWEALARRQTACRGKLFRLPILTGGWTGCQRLIKLGRNRGHRRQSRAAEARAAGPHVNLHHAARLARLRLRNLDSPACPGTWGQPERTANRPLSRSALAPSPTPSKLRHADGRANTPRAGGCDRRGCRPAWWRCRNALGCPG